MKDRLKFGLVSLCMMFVSSCANEELVEGLDTEVAKDFTVEVDLGLGSRAYYEEQNGAYPIKWNETDKIYVSSEDGKAYGTLSLDKFTDESGQRASFKGVIFGNKSKLAYAVYPVPDKKTKKVDLTSRKADMPNPPMIGTFGTDKTKVRFEETTPAILLTINDLPEGGILYVEGEEISGTAKAVPGEDGKYNLDYTSDGKGKIKITDLPAGRQTIYVPVITEAGDEIVSMRMTLSIGGAKYTKNVRFKNTLVTNVANGNGFLELTYHADTEELTEVWDGKASEKVEVNEGIVEIHTAAQLKGFADEVKAGKSYSGVTVKLINDIDLAGKSWIPVGEYGTENTYFRGTFDGNGKTIKNLNVAADHAGLFGVLLASTVKNLTIENASVNGTVYAGGIAGSCQGKNVLENVNMVNCTVNGVADSQTFIGGYASTGYAVINGVTEAVVANKEQLVKLLTLNEGNINIVLASDVIVDNMIKIQEGVEVCLDLNGKTINFERDDSFKPGNPVFYPLPGSKLTITGNGTIDFGDNYDAALVYPAGEVVIENGTFIRNRVPDGTSPDDVQTLFMGVKSVGASMVINGGYFDSGYYDKNVELDFSETEQDIENRGKAGDRNLVRTAIKNNLSLTINLSWSNAAGTQDFRIYGGTFVGANPAWGDEGCAMPITPNYLRPWSYYQGMFLVGQEMHDGEIVIPEGYKITEGETEDGRPTYTVTYNK